MRSEIGTATKSRLTFAIEIENDLATGKTVQDLIFHVVRDRLGMAQEFLGVADALLALGQRRREQMPLRSAVSRYYYAMFQAARGVVFLDHGGDDKNAHSELPKSLPQKFPRRAYHLNELKDARVSRNDADYDPYPNDVAHWLTAARSQKNAAIEFIDDCTSYLRALGI